jgi:hypothetical protein
MHLKNTDKLTLLIKPAALYISIVAIDMLHVARINCNILKIKESLWTA